MISDNSLLRIIQSAVQERNPLRKESNAYRLFNGYYEGYPGLLIDRYGDTLAIFDHEESGDIKNIIPQIVEWGMQKLTGINAVLLKKRQSPDKKMVNGILIAGEKTTKSINEFGVCYALYLQMNQDASFYLDTRNLRRWLLDHSSGMRVLNTFAYTGSLGIAAGKGGASLVIQTDRNKRFLEVAQKSWQLNDLDGEICQFISGDFFRVTGQMRHANRLFNCVILDPPYFSSTKGGRVDLQESITRLINKVRPLVTHEGWLVVINNALFTPGEAFMEDIKYLCKSSYLAFESIIPIPPDVTGYSNTIVGVPPVNPKPFNHPTKIVVLRVFRKDGKK